MTGVAGWPRLGWIARGTGLGAGVPSFGGPAAAAYPPSSVRGGPPRRPALAPQAHGTCPECGSERMVAGPARWSHRCEDCGHGGMLSAGGEPEAGA